MKSIAEFKRRIKLGAMLHVTHHQKFAGRDADGVVIYQDEDKGIRPVSIVQSNSFALATMKDGKLQDSWCNFPKSREIRFIDENTVQLLGEDNRSRPDNVMSAIFIPILTIEFVLSAEETEKRAENNTVHGANTITA